MSVTQITGYYFGELFSENSPFRPLRLYADDNVFDLMENSMTYRVNGSANFDRLINEKMHFEKYMHVHSRSSVLSEHIKSYLANS